MTTRYVPGVSSRISHLTGADACGERDSAHRDAPLAGSASQRAAPSSVSAHEQGSESRTQVGVVSEVRRTGTMSVQLSQRCQSIKVRETVKAKNKELSQRHNTGRIYPLI